MDYTTVDLLSVQFTATLQPTTGQTWATCEIWRYSTLISILNHRGLFSNQVTLRFKLRPEPFFRVHWEHWHPKVPPSSLELPEQESALEAMETLYAKFANTLVCTAIFWSAGRTTFIDDVDVGFKTESAKAAWMRVILWESSVVLGDTASRDDLHGINQLNTCVADHPNNWRIDWSIDWTFILHKPTCGLDTALKMDSHPMIIYDLCWTLNLTGIHFKQPSFSGTLKTKSFGKWLDWRRHPTLCCILQQ